jgi:DNA-binding XRE family transcriptional regulator
VPKPKPDGYPANPTTVGGHIRKVRMDKGLFQREVAAIIGVTEDTITFWENGRAEPQIHFAPKIVNFLGYSPYPADLTTLGGRIKHYRLIKGLSQGKFGEMLGVDGSTVCSWELGQFIPNSNVINTIQEHLESASRLIESTIL